MDENYRYHILALIDLFGQPLYTISLKITLLLDPFVKLTYAIVMKLLESKSSLVDLTVFVFVLGLLTACDATENGATTFSNIPKEHHIADTNETNASDAVESSQGVKTVRLVADRNYRPYSYVENNELKGLLIDVMNAIDNEMPNFTIDITPSKWSSGKAAVRKGDYTGLIGAYFHGEDWPNIYPYSYPILFESLVTVCSSRFVSDQKTQWPTDYAGLIVGTVAGYDGWLGDGVKYRNINTINFFEFPNTDLALMGVYNDIVECTLFEEASFVDTMKKLLAKGKIKDISKLSIVNFLAKHSVHIAYSEKLATGKESASAYAFRKAFDAQLFAMLQSGELAPIFEKYGVQFR